LTAAAPLIGVTADRTWPGLSPGVLVMAHHWAEQGYKVLVVDAELGAGELTRWAVDAGAGPFDGSVERVLREHQGTPRSAPITAQLAELLNAPAPQGSVELVAAYDKPPTGYPPPPGGRDVLLLRDLLRGLENGPRRPDVVLVRLPSLSTGLGVALAGNLVDRLIVATEGSAMCLRRVRRALIEVSALRGASVPVHLVELDGATEWNPKASEGTWLHHLTAVPELRVRPAGQLGFVSLTQDWPLLEDFADLAHHVRVQLGLKHPDPRERILEAEATERPELVFDGFAQLFDESPSEAMAFFMKYLSGRSATRMSTVQAVRALAASPKANLDELHRAFWYAVQKFRITAPDALSESMFEIGQRLLADVRAGPLKHITDRVLIDVAESGLFYASWCAKKGEPSHKIIQDSERLLMEVAPSIPASVAPVKARFAHALANLACVGRHERHYDLAMRTLQGLLDAGTSVDVAQRDMLDAQWKFFLATKNRDFGERLAQFAMSLATEQPGYCHYYLAGWYTATNDKVAGVEHFIQLAVANPDLFRLFLQDPDMLFFFDGVGTEHFYAVPMKDEF